MRPRQKSFTTGYAKSPSRGGGSPKPSPGCCGSAAPKEEGDGSRVVMNTGGQEEAARFHKKGMTTCAGPPARRPWPTLLTVAQRTEGPGLHSGYALQSYRDRASETSNV